MLSEAERPQSAAPGVRLLIYGFFGGREACDTTRVRHKQPNPGSSLEQSNATTGNITRVTEE